MEFLQNILDSTDIPVLSAFILGIMTALSPCPLATNITAIGYIGKTIDDRRQIFLNGLYYTAGRIISYTILGLVLYFGASRFQVARFFSLYGEKVIGPIMILIGIMMTGVLNPVFPGFSKITTRISGIAGKGKGTGALLLGLIFALAFCPYSGVLYFTILIPLAVASVAGLYLPVVFAVATSIPVIIIAYILAFSISGLVVFYQKISVFQKWFNYMVALLFIMAGLYFVITVYFLV